MKHICQGPKCHTYDTQSRIRGTKGNKVLRTRTARYDIDLVHNHWAMQWEYYFCDERCLQNWLNEHMPRLINFIGINKKPNETPIEIVDETKTNWTGQEYTIKTINILTEKTA